VHHHLIVLADQRFGWSYRNSPEVWNQASV